MSTSEESSADLSLCAVENFSPSKWLTLGRARIEDPPHCPLVGEYTGVIPDADGLCARSYTDCNNPEVMFYTVYSCNNQTEVSYGEYKEGGKFENSCSSSRFSGQQCNTTFMIITVVPTK